MLKQMIIYQHKCIEIFEYSYTITLLAYFSMPSKHACCLSPRMIYQGKAAF